MFLVSSLQIMDWAVLLMDEATVDLKDMSEAFNSLRNGLLQITEQVSQASKVFAEY
jgi:ABC-type uncharacterized transport system ATPase subunit